MTYAGQAAKLLLRGSRKNRVAEDARFARRTEE